jgi:MFS family permease
VRHDLHISDVQFSLLQGLAFSVIYCVLGLPIGWMADRMQRKYLVSAGILLWSLMTAACGMASSFGTLAMARIGVGVGEASLSPAGYSLLADSFPPKRLIRATSAFAMAAALGFGVALFVGGLVIGTVSHRAHPLPLIGGLAPWQQAFILVSLPGVLLGFVALLIREPPRHETAHFDVQGQQTLVQTLAYLWSRRREYAPYYLAVTFLGIITLGGMAWFPAHLMRSFGMPAARVGVVIGTTQLIGSLVGTVGGAWMSERFVRLGYERPYLRTVAIIAILSIVPTIAAPLVPNANAAIAIWLIAQTIQSAFYGSATAALQLMTPNRMRAVNSALLLLIANLVDLGFGTLLIGSITQYVFHSDVAVGKSLALVGGASAIIATFVTIGALRSDRPARPQPVRLKSL